MRNQKGQTLVETLVAAAMMAIVGYAAAITVEAVQRRAALTGAISELRSVFLYTRTLAVTRDRNVAMRFREDGKAWTWTIYEDGDGDGVRNDDISKNIDRALTRPRRFQHSCARIGLPDVSMPDPMNGGVLESRPAVRFNSSQLCSFSRVGEVTNGSLVLTDGHTAAIVRVYGLTGRIAVLRWDGKQWKSGQ